MDRRHMLKSTASTALGAGLLVSAASAAKSAQPTSSHEKTRGADYVECADGTKLAYTDWGAGKPVVFIHAWALPSAMWDYQRGPLSEKGLRCIAYDRRGHGRSGVPNGGYDCDNLADDLSTLLDELDLHGVTLVSHSFGAAEVVRYLSRHGSSRIEKIALIAPAGTPFATKTADNPNGVPPEQLEFFRTRVLQQEDGKKAFFTADTSLSLQNWGMALMLTTPLRVAVECNRQITSTDFRAELPKITVPTLIIHGDNDVSARIETTGRPTAALIPNAELKVYEGAPHGLFLTHKERLNADLLRFIKG
ncbi:Pimeloyl-ACP methyl ester carboxylesterase [Bradyrhizobium lablabi]|uniref:Pimeloyl-ACP methyl ester carboxylesterase n=2 Tax=Bradyrhizobium lablabi TaxID=722472 RepID=A0A1M7AJY4_9BRAD|nr:Pimeloyl-ACP methyl ester carboxylesterase [Bradyrhizobium lablabi]